MLKFVILLWGILTSPPSVSVVEHSSSNPKVPGLIPGPVLTGVMDYDEACFMHLTPGVVHNFPKAVGV